MGILDDFRARAASRLDSAAFAARVDALRAETDGLLDDEALGLLVLDELGLNDGAFVSLADARGRPEASVEATVTAAPTTRTFSRRDGTTGEVTNVRLEDASARATLVLWDRDGDKAAGLAPGSKVRIVNARVKESKFGLELVASPWTVVEVPGAPSRARAKLLADVAEAGSPPAEETVLVRVDPTRSRFDEGRVVFEADALVRAGATETRVTVRDEAVRALRSIPVGARVRVHGPRDDAKVERA